MHTQLHLNLPEAVYEFWGKYPLVSMWYEYTVNYYDATRDHLTLSEEPQYHHYHCGDEDCAYCELVSKGISPDRYMYSGETLADFMTFEQFNAQHPIYFEEVDGEQVWYRRNCPTSWSQLKSYCYYGPYGEDKHDDRPEPGNYYGYSAGDIVYPKHFHEVDNGWLAPSGTFYYVPDYDRHSFAHHGTARLLGFSGCEDIEAKGYIHISSYYSQSMRFYAVPAKPTKAQIDIANQYAEATNTLLPDTLKYKEEVVFTQAPTIVPFTYWQRVEDSCKPRSFRDRFYPLSGD